MGFFLYLMAVNIITFLVYAADKHRAVLGKWRISELTLLLLAAAGGAAGALLAMLVFRHKIRKMKFMLLVPLLLAGWAILLVYLL